MEIFKKAQQHPKLQSIISDLQGLVSSNQDLRHSLLNLDEYIENYDPNLLILGEIWKKEGATDNFREKLEVEIVTEQAKNEGLTKRLKYAVKQQELLNTQKEDQMDDMAFGYQFLRSQWTRYRMRNINNLDDRMDLLNKMISKIRFKTMQKLSNVKYQNNVSRYDLSFSQIQRLSQMQCKCDRITMHNEDLLCQVQRLEQRNEYLSYHYNRTQIQITKTKQKLKAIENRFLSCSKKNVELQEVLRKTNDEILSLKKLNKRIYINTDEKLEIQLRYPHVIKGQFSTIRTIDQILEFISGNHQRFLAESDSQFPVIVEINSSQSIQPVKIFPLSTVGKSSPQIGSLLKIPSSARNIESDKRSLRRQSSEGLIINNSPAKQIERTLKYANSAKKICYVKNMSRGKNSDVERSFYVKLESLDKANPLN